MTKINSGAPVTGAASIQIDAMPDVVWEVISDVNGWPSWNPDVSGAQLLGPLAVGTEFRWKAGPGTITSTLLEVEPLREISWRGKSLGVSALHVWRLRPAAQGVTLEVEESLEGLPARLFRASLRRTLETALQNGLTAVKLEAERRGSCGA
ncbi:MAG: SRPBCC family protein [Polyangiaceae bacterium]|nr:SRPBCC family protein [Myxococcales bacterium]MCB9586945.1 SRPBCC family protein [Polyangiaceae bacterium]MCB9608234.1 SRPBCC family protein [Polyangiaceae bacterium]